MSEISIQNSVTKELQKLEYATRIRNYGMARVCGRRASGMAIHYWLEKESREGDYGSSYINHLKALAEDESIHPDVRAAAKRLTVSKDKVGKQEISVNPLADAILIIRYVEHRLNEVIFPVDQD